MKKKKTKIGVEVSQTFGMKPGEEEKFWVVVAHQSRAQIFRYRSGDGAMDLVADIPHPLGRRKGREIVSDRPGRTFDSWTRATGGHMTGAPRHSYGSEEPPHSHELKVMTEKIHKKIESARISHQFDKLILVMAPRLLGSLKSKLSPASQARIAAQLERDYAWITRPELEKRLVKQLALKKVRPIRQVPPPMGAFRVSTK